MLRLCYCNECKTCVKLNSNGSCSVCFGRSIEEVFIRFGTQRFSQARINVDQAEENNQISEENILRLLPEGIEPSENCNGKDCPICLVEFIHPNEDNANIIVAKCGHTVHHSCMRRWLLNSLKNECPVCRGKVL